MSNYDGNGGLGRRMVSNIGGANAELQLKALQQQNADLMAEFKRLSLQPLALGYVLAVGADKTVVLTPNGMVEVLPTPNLELDAGTGVRMTNQGTIVEVAKTIPKVGNVATVLAVVDEKHVEVDDHGKNVIVLYGKRVAGEMKKSDRVQLDPTGSVVIRNLGHPPPTPRASTTGVTWDDIGGLAEVKRALIEAVEEPYTHAALYKRYGKQPVKGILLHGPPGTGKTMLAKAIHSSLTAIHGASASETGFIYVKGPEILSKWLGNSEASVRKLFIAARQHHAEHGYPAIILIDEADAVLGSRGGDHEGAEKTTVPQFLAEMDGLDETGALVVLTTNRPDALDAAVTRYGRIDRKIFVPRPSEEEARAILHRAFAGKPFDPASFPNSPSLLGATSFAVERLWSKEFRLYTITFRDKSTQHVCLSDLVNGAMLASGVAETAVQNAIRREKKAGSAAGVNRDDISAAVTEVFEENRRLDHSIDLGLIIEPMKARIVDVSRATAHSGLIQLA